MTPTDGWGIPVSSSAEIGDGFPWLGLWRSLLIMVLRPLRRHVGWRIVLWIARRRMFRLLQRLGIDTFYRVVFRGTTLTFRCAFGEEESYILGDPIPDGYFLPVRRDDTDLRTVFVGDNDERRVQSPFHVPRVPLLLHFGFETTDGRPLFALGNLRWSPLGDYRPFYWLRFDLHHSNRDFGRVYEGRAYVEDVPLGNVPTGAIARPPDSSDQSE